MCPKSILVPHDVLPHGHSLSQSDCLRKIITEVLDCWQAIPLQKHLQCIYKLGTEEDWYKV